MTASYWWLVILGAGIGTYALRAAPFVWERLRRLAERHVKFLSFLSFAIAAGIVARAVVYRGAELSPPSEMGIKVAAIVFAVALLKLTRSVPIALFAGAGFGVLLKWWGI